MKESNPQDAKAWLTQACAEFGSSLGSEPARPIEAYLDGSVSRPLVLEELLRIELAWRIQSGQTPTLQEYAKRFPQELQVIQRVFSELSSDRDASQIGHRSLGTKRVETSDFDSNIGFESRTLPQIPFGSNLPASDFGDYQIIREIASGGMGVVYQAKHLKLDRTIALKMLLSNDSTSVEERERFKAEAMAVAKLDHPGIVPIYDVGEVEGRSYIAMAYVDGESLAQRVQRNGPLAPRIAVKLVVEIAQAIQHAHDKGIDHPSRPQAAEHSDREKRCRPSD